MSSSLCVESPASGFCFDNCKRNKILAEQGFPIPKAVKTGTTIVGILFRDGVILGADTRATSDNIVANKNCSKIHYLAPNMYCCGAGTAADTEMTTKIISSNLALHRLNTGRTVPVIVASRMLKQMLFKYQGYVSAALVLGGVDKDGGHINCIYPHGSTDSLPYVTMGSGSLAAMSVFESHWKPDMSLEDGKKLVRDAICAGIFNDLGSGSNVDLCVITKSGATLMRPYDEVNLKGQRQLSYRYKKGTTGVLSTRVIPVDVEETIIMKTRGSGEAMDTSS